MRFENEHPEHPEQKIQKEQKIENPGITFKFLHVIVVKQSNLKKGKQKKHHEICFRRP